MDVGAYSPLYRPDHYVPVAPVHLCTLLRCIEVVEEREEAALPPPERPEGRERPIYAVSPIGRIEPSDRDQPPRPVEFVRVMNWFHVTNLGTLLDVLA
jgi:hypothetical protein